MCGEILFNSDMSLELDRQLIMSERQQSRIQYLEGIVTAADDLDLDEGAQQ